MFLDFFLRFLVGLLVGIYSMKYIAQGRVNIGLKVLFVFIVATVAAIL